MMPRGIVVHLGLLVVAAVATVLVWTREKETVVSPGEVTVWNGRAADIERVAYSSKARKVSMEAKKDANGVWFTGTSETIPAAGADAGAQAPPKVVSFVSVTQGNKLAELLAPLRGMREIGRIGPDRAAEFGLKEPDGTLSARIAGTEHALTLGGHTPGGGDRYVRDEASSIVYVVKGEVTRDLEGGEASLAERELHDFKDPDLESIRITSHGKSREVLRRGPESKRIWADPSDPEKQDETVANWITKVDRLRPGDYPSPEPTAPEVVLRIDYKVKGLQLAYLEMAKVPGTSAPVTPATAPASPKPDFLIRSERTRQWAKVAGPGGEQVDQDVTSVLK
jgi:hypothetical protein